MAADGKRFRSSRACTSCRQMKVKCDRRHKASHRCTRCETADTECEIDHNFQRRRTKGSNDDFQILRREVELLKSQVAPLVPRTISGILPDDGSPVPGSSSSIYHSTPAYTLTLPRSTAEVTLLPWQIDKGFDTFFEKMHPFLPFLVRPEPNHCFEREPFLFWTICMLGLRREAAPCAKALAAYVSSEAIQGPYSRCHSQSKATSVVQALLLLSLWPFNSTSQLREHVWLHVGAATHLALQIGLNQPFAASEYVPKDGRKDIPSLIPEFHRTWVACYIVNTIVAFKRGIPSTLRTDHSIIQYTRDIATTVGIPDGLLKMLLIVRRIEEGQDMGNPRFTLNGSVEPGCREAVYHLLQSNIADTEMQISSSSSYLQLLVNAAKQQSQIQTLYCDSPIPLQERVVLAGIQTSMQTIRLSRQIQLEVGTIFLPMHFDSLVVTAALFLFKVLISRFASFANEDEVQDHIAQARTFFREGIHDFNDVPQRLNKFLDGLYELVMDGHLPVGGYIIENVRHRNTQNILYEILWIFHEWKRQANTGAKSRERSCTAPRITDREAPDIMDAALEPLPLDEDFWRLFEKEGFYGSQYSMESHV